MSDETTLIVVCVIAVCNVGLAGLTGYYARRARTAAERAATARERAAAARARVHP